ncbi:MAG: class I SAM-dependent methyltransferase [Acidimicrobiales bacterium]
MDPKKVVADGYDRLYQAYADWGGGHPDIRHQCIDRMFDLGLSLPAQALDLGCGTGRHATSYLVERGLDVTGVDVSPRSIEAARSEIPDAKFLVGDMTQVVFPESSFDVITAFYSIIHVPRDDHSLVLGQVGTWLRPGGYLAAIMSGGAGSAVEFSSAWLDVAPMFWSNWDHKTNLRLVREAGLEIIESGLEHFAEEGSPVTFLRLIAQKPLDQ